MDVREGLKQLEDESIDCVITSPPYWGLRDYGIAGQIGLEGHPQKYINKLVSIFGLMRKKLKKSGSFYLNIGDTYCGGGNWRVDKEGQKHLHPKEKGRTKIVLDIAGSSNWLQPKQLMLMPSRLAIALQEDGWICRNSIIWHKPSHMPSSVKDRLTNSYEHLFHFVKQKRYYYDLDSIRERHKTELAPFNYRVRDAERKFKSCPQFKASKEEIEKYNSPRAREEREGYNAQEHFYDPKGKNPGDTWKYDTKYEKDEYGQSLQGFVRNKTIEQARKDSRIDAKRLFPNDPKKQQEYINSVHDHLGHPLGKNPSDFWSINPQPFKEAHFAVFPEALCIKPIKASCPAQVCRKCGKPKERITKRDASLKDADLPQSKRKEPYRQSKGITVKGGGNYVQWLIDNPLKTIGFTKCDCNAGFDAGIVLDPFMGSGTVLVVAQKLRRNAIGIEIKPDYCEMAKKRLVDVDGQSYLSGDIDRVEVLK